MNMMIHGGISPTEQRNMFAQVKKNYSILMEAGEDPTEEEIALYEFLDSAEAVGLLLLVYDSLGAIKRRDFVFNFFNPEEIYSLDLNTDLINFCLKNDMLDVFDKIVSNVDNIDKRKTLALVLEHYPDNDQKAANAVPLIESGALNDDDREMIEEYLTDSPDSTANKYHTAVAACRSAARPSVECLMKTVIAHLSDGPELANIFEAVMSVELGDLETYTILEYALNECEDKACLFILNKFRETKQFVEFTHRHFAMILERRSPAEAKKKMIEAGLNFNVSPKNKELFISAYVCDTQDSVENRAELIPYLLSLIDSLSTNSIEKYLTSCSLDKEQKPAIVKLLFDMKINNSFFHNTLSNYIIHSGDPVEVKKEIIYILASAGLGVSHKAVFELLRSSAVPVEERVQILKLLKNGGLEYNEILTEYLNEVDYSDFNGYILTELISGATAISETALARYVLEFDDEPATKVTNVTKLASVCYSRLSGVRCSVNHNGNAVYCSVLQGYILNPPDPLNAALPILSAFRREFPELGAEVDASGVRMKFKKYVASQKKQLSEITKALCKEARI
ncbi:MAG: hypothetical protein IJF21_04480, partial [Clostridia bacterium]|nr:hypothetical protein [Clostridia bacterium]